MPSTRQNHAECVWVYVCVDEPCVHALWHRKYPKSTVISNINLKYNNLCNLVVFNIKSVSNEQTKITKTINIVNMNQFFVKYYKIAILEYIRWVLLLKRFNSENVNFYLTINKLHSTELISNKYSNHSFSPGPLVFFSHSYITLFFE